ncbi:WD40 repeat domain-containing protein [Undibacterium rugosum]|uniref:WD40 repeat domain-containing protein n=1 Tax=Undibacterium rugosum TaxID=2762291 RepID=UPI001B82D932|nr:WD40 repeat domain-containing protein [Undibacterium rugosum]MBR7779460.1 hypothetical protein [Undibacterium rugosum]
MLSLTAFGQDRANIIASEELSLKDVASIHLSDRGLSPSPGAFSLSANGKIGANIDINGKVLLWDTSTFKLLETIHVEGALPTAVALSAAGDKVAIGYIDGRVIVRSIDSTQFLREFNGHIGAISALAFSSNGQLLASGGVDATTQLWSLSADQRIGIFDSQFDGNGSSGRVIGIGFSGDGRRLIVNEWYSRFYDVGRGTTLWDVKDGIEVLTRNVAPPNADHMVRIGQVLGGNGWLLTYTGNEGLMTERLDSCAPPHQLKAGQFADTVAADPQGRWVAATEGTVLTFFGTGSNEKSYLITLPAKAISLVVEPEGRFIFALLAKEVRFNGNENFIFGRDAETLMQTMLYRIPIPDIVQRLPAIVVPANATVCRPTKAVRRLQDFVIPAKPSPLQIKARLIVPKELLADNGDSISRNLQEVNPAGSLYFSGNSNLTALYFSPNSGRRYGVGVWDLNTNKLLRSKFTKYMGSPPPMRTRGGWVSTGDSLVNLLTGRTLLEEIKSERTENSFSTLISDVETGDVYNVIQYPQTPFEHPTQFEHFDANGRRLKNLKNSGKVIGYAARNGRFAMLYESGDVRVLQIRRPHNSVLYKKAVKDDTQCAGGEMNLSSDGHYLQIAFANCSGDGPTEYRTYRLVSPRFPSFGTDELLTRFPARSNRRVVQDSRPHRLAVWDFDKGEIIARLPRQQSQNLDGVYQPLRATLSDDGQLLASASYDGKIRVWHLDARKMMGEVSIGGAVTAITFDSSGKQVAAAKEGGQIFVLKVPPFNGKVKRP